jgi:SAM-dependent methyltransferase
VRRSVAALIAALSAAAALHAAPQKAAPPRRALFPPLDFGLLEAPDRAAWQKPEQIMDTLGIADGGVVADIGTGSGWFTIYLARRVGPNGVVYAEDVQRESLEATRRRVTREGLRNVVVVRGSETDPNLPAGEIDAALVVDVYPEVDDRVSLLRNLARAIKPNGRIGVVNYKPGLVGPGPDDVRVAPSVVEADARAADLRVLSSEDLPYQYLLVLGRRVQ